MLRASATQKQQLIADLSAVINEQRQALLQAILAQRTRYLTVVLEDIYQSQNTSAVIRSAECLGLQEVHVIENRYEYELNRAVVMGASKWIEIVRHRQADADNTTACLGALKARGYRIVAMTLREDSIELDTLVLDQKLALCFGSEEPGLTTVAHDLADVFVRIPMCGFTQSFNLSVCAGIALAELTKKLRASNLDWQLDEADRTDLYIDWLANSTPTGKVLLERFMQAAGLPEQGRP